jgi:3-oxoacyl-[acyl-carrier protein] reductase
MNAPTSDLQGRHVIVTGAGQGIGRAISQLVLDLGGTVTAVDMNDEGINSLAAQSGSDRVLPLAGNVTDATFAAAVVGQSVSHFGAVHGLVNNAGVTRPAMIEKMTIEQWQQVLDVHLTGSFLFLQAAGRHMLQRSRNGDRTGGSVVNISSDAGRRGTIGQINYGAAKAGVLGLTMCAAREWAKYNVRVNTVGFGVVETPMTETIRSEKFADTYLAQIPLGRWAEAGEVARPVCFLLSDGASYVTGQHLSANGGYTIGM